jgi:NAD(P)-dependent dehydrogenase (short-subunit alcohol dehydrogenase family)
MNKIDLSGRVAVVTGGAQGFGRAIAERFVNSGARVAIWDLDQVFAQRTANEVGNGTKSYGLDVSELAAVEKARDATIKDFGKIDILVNNAALFAAVPHQKVTEIDTALWDKVFAVNVRGPFLMVKHVAPHMIAQRYGKIVNIGSGVAYKGLPNMSHYSASKGAIATLTRTLSRELGEHNICVNTLAPGLTMSDTLVESGTHSEQTRNTVLNSRAFKRDAFPQDLTGALVFLASPESDFMTGQTIAVDGGSVNT